MLLGVWLLALALRALYIWQISHAPFFDLRIGDAASYHRSAARIAAGDWLGQDVFYQAPLYPYFLAVVYTTFGDSVTIVRIVQAIIGATSCAILTAAGAALFGRIGALAGFGLAIYPAAIFLDGLLEKSALVTFFTCALVASLVRLTSLREGYGGPPERSARRRKPDTTGALAVGILLGLLALTRENALLLAAPVLLWIAFGPSEQPQRTRLRPALTFLAGCAIVLLPVGIRNAAVGGEFHLTTAQFGPNFYIGNHPGATGTYEPLVPGHGSAADERQDATRLAEQAAGTKLTPDQVSRFWTVRSLDYIRSQPIDWVRLMARKLALTFNAAEVADTESQEVYAEWSPLVRALRPFDFGVLFAMAAMGAVLTAGHWRRIWFLYAVAATYVVSVVIFYVFARYRFPIVPLLMLLAAGGVGELVAYVRQRRPSERKGVRYLEPAAPKRLRVGGSAAVAVVVAIAVAHLRLEDEHAARATHYYDIASILATDPARQEQAAAFYRRALAEVPAFPPAHLGLGTMLALAGRPLDAVPHYRAAVNAWPDNADARYNLGLALAATGQTQDASEQYREALRLRPDDADTHVALGKALVSLMRPDQAAEHYEKALTLQPAYVKALVGWGVALAELGRGAEAIAKYRRALELDPENAEAYNNLGGTLANEGRIAEALPYFERAVALKPGDENARRNLNLAREALAQSRRE